MTEVAKGWTFVTVQFALIGLLIYTPSAADWAFAGELVVVSLFGFALALVALLQLGKAATATPVPNKVGDLVITGLYRRVRHPIYTAILFGLFIVALNKQSFVSLTVWVSLSLLLFQKSKFEESLLRDKFSNYAEYEKSTGRFLPKIRKAK
jgi:protein-S-isoprenylcysteine O-methyltransferase Ste14